MTRIPTMEEIRRKIHAEVKRDISGAIKEVALVIAKYQLTESEFLVVADNMIRSFQAIREAQEKLRRKIQ